MGPLQVKRVLETMRLTHVYESTFLKVDESTVHMLQIVEPYVTFGVPSKKMVHQLIHKRGYCIVKNERKPMTDNRIIEDALGHLDILCLEDLIEALLVPTDDFDETAKFLWPFKLNA